MKSYRIPPLLTDIVRASLTSLDGMEFSSAEACPVCGGKLTGYDRKRKKFVQLREDEGNRTITVMVKRFYCGKCGRLCYADEPFYPGSRIGSPVIDLFLALSAAMPPSKAGQVIAALGISVNRTTWKNYAGWQTSGMPLVDAFGMKLPLCIVRLSDIALRDQPDPGAVIAACGFPSKVNWL